MIHGYIRLSDNLFPLHEGDIRLEHPEITEDQTHPNFPCPPTYAPVISSPPPDYDNETQTITCTPTKMPDGTYQIVWTVQHLDEKTLLVRKSLLDAYNAKKKKT
jgi:hypothetical protein